MINRAIKMVLSKPDIMGIMMLLFQMKGDAFFHEESQKWGMDGS